MKVSMTSRRLLYDRWVPGSGFHHVEVLFFLTDFLLHYDLLGGKKMGSFVLLRDKLREDLFFILEYYKVRSDRMG